MREKQMRETGEEGRKRSTCNQSPNNSMFLCSKSGRKMLIGQDMSCEALSYGLVVTVGSQVHVKIKIFELAFLKQSVCSLEYAITSSMICKFRVSFH